MMVTVGDYFPFKHTAYFQAPLRKFRECIQQKIMAQTFLGFFRNISIWQKKKVKKGLMQNIGSQLAVMGESQGVFHPDTKWHGFRRKKDNGPVVFAPQHNGWVVVSSISMFIPS